ncbi:MAG TPA: type IV toxin-antitoxin system AbiEi family antitoxin domain-containing protein [Thermoleophilaceae bacterium]|nr:type IV toxin-antitoxin system AbiEi family antitoxin domain-containing protein [Thermoleophilaceae bacterium]
MADTNDEHRSRELWKLVEGQHGVVSRTQLLARGYSAAAIAHRLAVGRLHPVQRGIYAVGRPELSRHGVWVAAAMSCGTEAVVSHDSAAQLWGIREARGRVEVTVPLHVRRRRPGMAIYQRTLPASERAAHEDVPVTTVHRTLLDLAARLSRGQLEAAINAADKLDLTNPERLRAALDDFAGRPGVKTLRRVLDRRTFTFTASELERWFLPLAHAAGLPRPLTSRQVNGFEVDYWPDLGLVVETDGLRYHRTPAAQTRDRLRDQTHARAGLTPLRFTHEQIRYEPSRVRATLSDVARRLGR